ncbi:MAG: chorismate synthase [Selenomonadaceae bacterium]
MAHLRFMTAGESHGPSLIALIEGMPSGLKLNIDTLNKDLARRQSGYGRGGRMKIEHDTMEILSGVRFGETLGGPISIKVNNHDFANWTKKMAAFGEEYGEKVTAARPGHADYAGIKKYARDDIRDILERSSARETTMRVAAGAIAKSFLSQFGIEVVSHVINIGGVAVDMKKIDRNAIKATDSELNCYDAEAEAKMKEHIDEAKAKGDTLGGIFEVIVKGVPIGLGSHVEWDRRLDAMLAGALMSIQAIKGVEVGDGFEAAVSFGSQAHDEMFYDEDGDVYRKTNHAGGIEGGMSNGEMIVLRAAMKPIPTLMTPLHSIDISSKKAVLASKERSDVCAVPAASVVGEAMVALVIADAMLDKFGGDSMIDIKNNVSAYLKRLEGVQNE